MENQNFQESLISTEDMQRRLIFLEIKVKELEDRKACNCTFDKSNDNRSVLALQAGHSYHSKTDENPQYDACNEMSYVKEKSESNESLEVVIRNYRALDHDEKALFLKSDLEVSPNASIESKKEDISIKVDDSSTNINMDDQEDEDFRRVIQRRREEIRNMYIRGEEEEVGEFTEQEHSMYIQNVGAFKEVFPATSEKIKDNVLSRWSNGNVELSIKTPEKSNSTDEIIILRPEEGSEDSDDAREFFNSNMNQQENEGGDLADNLSLEMLQIPPTSVEQLHNPLDQISPLEIFKQSQKITELNERLSIVEEFLKSAPLPSEHYFVNDISPLENITCSNKSMECEINSLKEILAEKADLNDLHNKVDHAQFNTVVQYLNGSIQEAIDFLGTQGNKWNDHDKEIQDSLGKLTSNYTEIKTLLDQKLIVYHKRLDKLAKLQSEQAAVGAAGRSQILRGQSCLACGASIVMRCEGGLRAPFRTFRPCAMRHYPNAENLTNNQKIINKKSSGCDYSKECHSENPENRDYICPRKTVGGVRFCGGEHTITSRQGVLHKQCRYWLPC